MTLMSGKTDAGRVLGQIRSLGSIDVFITRDTLHRRRKGSLERVRAPR